MNVGDLVARFGAHPADELEIDLDTDDGAGRWLVAACLYTDRIDAAISLAAARALGAADLACPMDIARARPEAIEALLRGARYPAPEATAQRIWRACHSLVERHGGSLDALVAQSDALDDLAARLSRLAPGFGAASVARFLRPLRDRWIQAREIPLHPAARAAALHLGLLRDGEDEEGEPGALRAALRSDPAQPSLADAEFVLAEIGRAACLRNRAARCLLAEACPLLAAGSGARAPSRSAPRATCE